MQILKGDFNDFENFKEVIDDWDLDFNILSRDDFGAYFHMFTSATFTISREKLQGTVEHRGLSPEGFRTIVIPINFENEFVWYNKKVSSNDLLIFPKNNIIDVVTYSGLDIYLISIEEKALFSAIENFRYPNCERIFNGDRAELYLSHHFTSQFHYLANKLVDNAHVKTGSDDAIVNRIIYFLLNYIEHSNQDKRFSSAKHKIIALKKAVELINDEQEQLPSIQTLCKETGVSERTLYNAFASKYQVSPSEYIKAVRLNRVKNDLFTQPEKGISFLAGKQHFWHMGQFAQDFKKQFGMLPSEFLKRNKKSSVK